MEGDKRSFDVKTYNKQLVVPSLPVQEQWLQQSNLDLIFPPPPVDVSVFFCYRKPTSDVTFSSMVCILKKSLAEALVVYYPLAGEMMKNVAGEHELLCNNRGVDFFEAVADIELREIDLYKPDETINGKVLPCKKEGVLAIQVTEFKCGGVVVGCTFDHRVADAFSANMLFLSWSEMALSRSPSIQPSFSRSLLLPRYPILYDHSIHELYIPVLTLPPPRPEPTGAISRIYCVSKESIRQLQTLANDNNFITKTKATKIEAFSAFLWKIIAIGTSAKDEKYCRLGIVIDGRKRLFNSVLCSNYFGNILSIPFGKKILGELKNKPLSLIANEVHKLLQNYGTKEHFQGLIDYVEAYCPEPIAPKICVERDTDEEVAIVVSSGQWFPVEMIDFGCGRPVFRCYYYPWGAQSGYVMPVPSARGNGDWIVYMNLLKEQFDAIEMYASHVFKPMKSDYF